MGVLSEFRWLSKFGPVFGVHGRNVQVLNEPAQFYQALNSYALSAKHRIVLAALYLGTGELESKFVENLHTAVANKPSGELQLTVLLDYTRGSRGGDCSSRTLLTPLLKDFPSSVSVSLYHSPKLRGFVKWLLPQKWNEIIGLQHIKVYIFDDDVILSGANLSDQYFEQRQDRYVVFKDSPELANYYASLVETVGKFSFQLDSSNKLSLQDPSSLHPYRTSLAKFILNSKKLLETFTKPNKKIGDVIPYDTHVYPLVQMGQLKFGNDSEVTTSLLKYLPQRSEVRLATGYFNLIPEYEDIIAGGKAAFQVATAHPSANSFYKAPGAMYYIPILYTYLLSLFYKKTQDVRDRVKLYEYDRPGWTFHGKGLWYYPPSEGKPALTMIGSPNFGYRSVNRDLESQVVIVTEDDQLRDRLEQEQKVLYSTTHEVNSGTFVDPERKVPYWVTWVSPIIRGFF